MSTAKSPGKPAVALIAGPTASGKSDLAVRLALALRARGRRARVINADSSQVYSDLRVLSARPTEEEMRGVPHRLFGERDGSQVYSAAEWAAKARNIIFGCTRHGTVPIVVGGTGLYIMTLVEGIAPIPRVEARIKDAVRAMSTEAAYEALLREDPQRARRLHPNDTARIQRSLEVLRSSGASITYWQATKSFRLADQVALYPAVLLPPREVVYARCESRLERMFASGAIEEVRALLARNLDPTLPVTRAIGVREIGAMLAGECSYQEALASSQQATRNYAKRQYTWLANKTPADWPRFETERYDENELFASLLRRMSLT